MKRILKKLIDKTFLKFIAVGLINTAVGTGVMLLAYNLFHCSYWISSALNYTIGSIVSFILNKKLTFENKEKGLKPIAKFVLTIGSCYIIAYGVAKPIARMLLSGLPVKIQENAAMLAGMGLFVILNYLGQRFFAFNNKQRQE